LPFPLSRAVRTIAAVKLSEEKKRNASA